MAESDESPSGLRSKNSQTKMEAAVEIAKRVFEKHFPDSGYSIENIIYCRHDREILDKAKQEDASQGGFEIHHPRYGQIALVHVPKGTSPSIGIVNSHSGLGYEIAKAYQEHGKFRERPRVFKNDNILSARKQFCNRLT